MKIRTFLLAASLAATGFNAAGAEAYRWVDAEGNVVYSQTPPADRDQAEEIKLPPVSRQPAAQPKERAAEQGEQEAEHYDRKKLQAMDPKLRIQYCEKARKNIEILEKAEPGSAFVNERNEIVKFSEEEKAGRLSEARQAEKMYCAK